MSLWQRFNDRRSLSVICGLVCLAVALPTAKAADTFDGTYAGKRMLTKGPAQLCPAEEGVSVIIAGTVLTFTGGALRHYAIGFAPRPDGSFSELHVDIGGDTVTIEGRISRDSLDADVTDYATGCEHHWHLTKEPRQ